MFEALALAYPNICKAMRRRHGMNASDTAALILAIKYPGRAGAWSPMDCSKARGLIVAAIVTRPRLHVAG